MTYYHLIKKQLPMKSEHSKKNFKKTTEMYKFLKKINLIAKKIYRLISSVENLSAQ